MSVNITGSKYGDSPITAVGTSTVTIGVPTFVVNDFKVPRRAQLHSASGVKKGDAFVRACYNSTLIELETPFQNWKDGSTVTQAIGDIVLISKNFADVATTGIAVDGLFVTLSDSILFGTDNQPTSVCFHDEGKSIRHTIVSTFYLQLGFSGGTTTFGHLQSWANKSVYAPCSYRSNTNTGNLVNFTYFTSDAASFMMFGGTVSVEAYVGQAYNGSGGVGGDAAYMWMLGVRFENVNILSRNLGGDWGDGTNHLLENCSFTGNTPNLIMVRWGNGLVRGGFYKITNFSSDPISVFGSDASGTFPIGAPAGQRAVVADNGNNIRLWRSNSAPTQDINVTNLISTNFATGNSNATLLQYFSDTYTSLQAGSVGVVTLDADSSVADSSASTSTAWSATVKYDKYIGNAHQVGFPLGPWTYGIKKYGYGAESGAIAVSNYDLGTAGVAKNVAFGGAVIQSADASITLSQSAANALATLPTLDNVYDSTIAWSVLNVTNAQYPSLGAYMVSAMGTSLDFGSRNIVVDATAGVAFAVNTGTNTVTIKASTLGVGTKFIKIVTSGTITFVNGAAPSATLVYQSSAGTSVPVVVNGIRNGTKVRVIRTDTNAEMAIGSAGATNFAARVTWATDLPLRANTVYVNGLDAEAQAFALGTLTNLGALITVTQVPAVIYEANAIDGSTVTGLSLDAPNIEIDANEADHTMSVQEIYAWYLYTLMSDAGMRTVFGGILPVNTSKYNVPVSVVNLKIHNTDVVNTLMITGGIIARSDGTSIRKGGSTATYGSIEVTPNEVYTIETGVSGLTPTEATQLASIAPIKDLIEADEYHTTTTVTKKLRGTSSVLLVKNFTGIPLISLQVTQ